MDKLPIEICEKIFWKILWKDPAELCRLRLVCKTWKEIIDECWSRLFQLWQNKCSEIPEQSFNDIAQTLFPLSSKPWQKMYWKDRMLPHVPRAVYRAWKNLPNLIGDNIEITKSPISIRNSEKYPSFAMNDKYLAVSYGAFESSDSESDYDSDYDEYYGRHRNRVNYTTCIYKLDNLEKAVRSYSLNCKNIDFYTVGTRTFVILQARAYSYYDKLYQSFRTEWSVTISEFEKNNQTSRLPFSSYAIVDNECFSFIGLTLTHKIFTGETEPIFTNGTEISLPTEDIGDDKEIKKVRIEGSELQVLVSGRESANSVWIFRYEITRGSDDTLNFTPNATNFIQKVTVNFPYGCMSKKKPMDIGFYVKRDQFKKWVQKHYRLSITSLIVHGDYIITGTGSGKIFIFHRGIDEIMECISQKKISHDYVVIDLKVRNFRESAAPIGLAYIDSTPRLLLDANDSLTAIDFL